MRWFHTVLSTGVVRGCEDNAPSGCVLPDEVGHGRCGEDAILADDELRHLKNGKIATPLFSLFTMDTDDFHLVSCSDLDDLAGDVLHAVPAIASDNECRTFKIAANRLKSTLDEVLDVVGLEELRAFLPEPRRARLLAGKRTCSDGLHFLGHDWDWKWDGPDDECRYDGQRTKP